MRPVGYYVDCDTAYCEDCVPGDVEDHDPIWSWSESDTPTHCAKCESLIPHTLTSDGLEYVAEHYRDDPESPIVAQWVAEYLSPGFVERERIHASVRTQVNAAADGTLPPYADGGYPLVYTDEDGSVLCAECATRDMADPDGVWTVNGWFLHYEGPPEWCDHCGEAIESAYGDPDENP